MIVFVDCVAFRHYRSQNIWVRVCITSSAIVVVTVQCNRRQLTTGSSSDLSLVDCQRSLHSRFLCRLSTRLALPQTTRCTRLLATRVKEVSTNTIVIATAVSFVFSYSYFQISFYVIAVDSSAGQTWQCDGE